MNVIRDSMKGIRASEEMKRNTLQYLENQQKQRNGSGAHYGVKYVFVALCLLFLMGVGGYSAYIRPVSYISIDVNPSIEFGVNQLGRVVTVSAYNEDGRNVLSRMSLKNATYMQAIHSLLEDNEYCKFLARDAQLVITVISDKPDIIVREIENDILLQSYGAVACTSNINCMQEAHLHDMSFGKYEAYMELLQYDESVTVEECHRMTMGEIRRRIQGCRSSDESGIKGECTEMGRWETEGEDNTEAEGTNKKDDMTGTKETSAEENGITDTKGTKTEENGITDTKGTKTEENGITDTKGTKTEENGIIDTEGTKIEENSITEMEGTREEGNNWTGMGTGTGGTHHEEHHDH